MNLSANNFRSIKEKFLTFKNLPKKQKTSLLTFLGLLIVLPIVSLATYNAIRYSSRANYPATPPATPITPPNLTPIPPSFKSVFNEAIYLDNMTSYPSWSWNYVKIPRFAIGESSTFEAWIKLERDIQGNNSILFKENGFNFAVEGDGKGNNKLFFGSSEFGSANSDSSNIIKRGIWYHVAIVRNGQSKTIKLFLNGKDVTRNDASYYKHGENFNGTVVIGASFQQAYSQPSAGIPATIDEVRISNVARYDSNFSVSFSSPFEKDDSTQLLYHFDANFEEASKDPSKTAIPNDDDDVKFIAGYPLTYSKPYLKRPVNWETEDVSLSADDFYLVIDGRVYQPEENVEISSEAKDSTHTNFKASWKNQGQQIILNIVFYASENPYEASWWVPEITTSINDLSESRLYYKDLYTSPILKQNLNTPLEASPYINIFSNPRPINNSFGKIYFENLKLLPSFKRKPGDQPVVNLKLKLQGINQKRKNQTIDIHLFKNGQKYKDLNALNAYSDENGNYYIRTLAEPGNYDFYIKGPTHLQRKFKNIAVGEGENNIDLSANPLLSGNATDREEEKTYGIINILDFSILARDYKQSESPADFDANGVVNIVDFSILATNYDKQGDKLP